MGDEAARITWAAAWLDTHYHGQRTFTQAEGARIREEMFHDLPAELWPSSAVMRAEYRAALRREEGLPDDEGLA